MFKLSEFVQGNITTEYKDELEDVVSFVDMIDTEIRERAGWEEWEGYEGICERPTTYDEFIYEVDDDFMADWAMGVGDIAVGAFKAALLRKNNVVKLAHNSYDAGGDTQAEVDIYLRAEEAGVDRLFAETRSTGCVFNGVPIVVQELVPNKSNYGSDKSQSKLTDRASDLAADMDMCDGLVNAMAEYYDSEFVEKALQFIADEEINDIHMGNWGFAKDGRPVIFDYASA